MVFLAALVPLTLKLGSRAPVGLARMAQVYVRFASPPSSAPRTLSVVVLPVMTAGDALAGVATVGAWFTGRVTVTLTVLVTDRPAASLMVTTKVYAPDAVKVAVAFFAALL